MKMNHIEKGTVIIPNYEPEDDLKLRDREIKAVEFKDSEFKEVPAELLNRQELQRVAFIGCRFPHVRDREIKVVKFKDSEFKEVPAELLNHQELQRVAFNCCRFSHVTSLEHLKYCRNLTELTLKDCGLETFPDVTSSLHTLKSLNVSRNSFVGGLPNSMGNLRNLKTLNISGCRLSKFPRVVCKLESLKELDISANEIQILPETLTTYFLFGKTGDIIL